MIQLGPATFNETLYQYSVVTDPDKLQLFVLARNVTGFMIDYAKKVHMYLQYQGLTNFLGGVLMLHRCTKYDLKYY